MPTFSNPGTQVLVNVLVQRHCVWGSPKSRLARWIHNMIVTFLLTEGCYNMILHLNVLDKDILVFILIYSILLYIAICTSTCTFTLNT